METIDYKNPGLDKSLWAAGPWDNEPDKKQWRDAATGLPCLIVRNHYGNLCGYVGVFESHLFYGKDYDAPDVDVHGGLTFADKCHESANECDGICHKAPEGEDNVWWLGFDCAHAWDFGPRDLYRAEHEGGIWRISPDCQYRDFSYVTAEVARLAAQLKAAA